LDARSGGVVMSKIRTQVSIVPENSFEEVNEENQFSNLNDLGFVTPDTASEQWISLVNDAWMTTDLPENELVRDYLSFMLERYMTRNDLYQTLAAFNYIQHLLQGDNIDPCCMQEVADISLQYVSFVPGRSRHRNEPRSLKYSYELGSDLFAILANANEDKDDWLSLAYQEMSDNFDIATKVLRSIKSPLQEINISDSKNIFPDVYEATKDMINRYSLYTTQ
jgi:hypothetical protein